MWSDLKKGLGIQLWCLEGDFNAIANKHERKKTKNMLNEEKAERPHEIEVEVEVEHEAVTVVVAMALSMRVRVKYERVRE